MYYRAKQRALSNGQKYHIAAILRRKKRIVRIGVNSHKTHPRYGRSYPDGSTAYCMHAEMDVLRFSQPGDTLEVMRFLPHGGFSMAKPCKLCMCEIKKLGIKQIRYTTRGGTWRTETIGNNNGHD